MENSLLLLKIQFQKISETLISRNYKIDITIFHILSVIIILCILYYVYHTVYTMYTILCIICCVHCTVYDILATLITN